MSDGPAAKRAIDVPLPRHPAQGVATGRLVAGGLVLLIGVFLVASGGTLFRIIGVLYLVFGTPLVLLGFRARRRIAAVQLVNTALNRIALGRLEEAEQLLDRAEALRPARPVLLAATLQRIFIAMRRGDVGGGLAHA